MLRRISSSVGAVPRNGRHTPRSDTDGWTTSARSDPWQSLAVHRPKTLQDSNVSLASA